MIAGLLAGNGTAFAVNHVVFFSTVPSVAEGCRLRAVG